jgi:pyruvate formate lyase activating enzyme
MSTLKEVLDQHVSEAASELYEKLDRNRVRCYSCGHCCPIADGQAGVCKVRFNRGGTLYVPWGYVGGVQCDPVEKKPFFHAYCGALAYSFGMLGCDLHCSYCQNWVTSQAIRDPHAMASFAVDWVSNDPRMFGTAYQHFRAALIADSPPRLAD